MARNTTSRWTLPLTALLFLNAVLVATAARQVGLVPQAMATDSSGAASPVAPSLAVNPLATPTAAGPDSVAAPAAVEPPTGAEPTVALPPAAGAEACPYDEAVGSPSIVSAAASATPLEVVLTLDESNYAAENTPAGLPREPVLGVTPAIVPPSAAEEEPAFRALEILVFINPPATGGVVHFLIADEVISLAPGEFHQVAAAEERSVQFHRGDDFGDAEHRCQFGVYAFAVGDTGWTLGEASGAQAQRWLQICRPVAMLEETDLD